MCRIRIWLSQEIGDDIAGGKLRLSIYEKEKAKGDEKSATKIVIFMKISSLF